MPELCQVHLRLSQFELRFRGCEVFVSCSFDQLAHDGIELIVFGLRLRLLFHPEPIRHPFEFRLRLSKLRLGLREQLAKLKRLQLDQRFANLYRLSLDRPHPSHPPADSRPNPDLVRFNGPGDLEWHVTLLAVDQQADENHSREGGTKGTIGHGNTLH